jgi:hypothetical protein
MHAPAYTVVTWRCVRTTRLSSAAAFSHFTLRNSKFELELERAVHSLNIFGVTSTTDSALDQAEPARRSGQF